MSGISTRGTARQQRLATMHAVTTRATGRRQRLATMHAVTTRGTARRQRLATMHAVTTRATGRRQRLATVHVVTVSGIADSGVQPRHLGRGPERAPQVLVAGNDAHESVDDRHAVTAPPDDVDAGAHRGERGAPRGGTITGPSIRNVLRACLCMSLRRRNPRNGIPTARPAGGTRRPGHGLVPRDARRAHRAHGTRRAHGLSCRSRRGRRPSWTRPGRGW